MRKWPGASPWHPRNPVLNDSSLRVLTAGRKDLSTIHLGSRSFYSVIQMGSSVTNYTQELPSLTRSLLSFKYHSHLCRSGTRRLAMRTRQTSGILAQIFWTTRRRGQNLLTLSRRALQVSICPQLSLRVAATIFPRDDTTRVGTHILGSFQMWFQKWKVAMILEVLLMLTGTRPNEARGGAVEPSHWLSLINICFRPPAQMVPIIFQVAGLLHGSNFKLLRSVSPERSLPLPSSPWRNVLGI